MGGGFIENVSQQTHIQTQREMSGGVLKETDSTGGLTAVAVEDLPWHGPNDISIVPGHFFSSRDVPKPKRDTLGES